MSEPNTQGEDLHGESWGVGQCDELALAVYSENPILEFDLAGAERFFGALSGEINELRSREEKTKSEASLERLSPKDLLPVEKPKGRARTGAERAGAYAALTLLSSLAKSRERSEWSKVLEFWQSKQGRHNLDVGLASTSLPRHVAHDPDEILELAQKLHRKPTPYAVGALLGAVLDVAATIEGDKPA